MHDIGLESSASKACPSGSDTFRDTEANTSQETPEDVEACSSKAMPGFDSRKELASLVLRLRAKNVPESSCKDVVEFVRSFTSHGITEYETNGRSQSASSGDGSKSEPDVPCLKACDVFLRTDHLENAALNPISGRGGGCFYPPLGFFLSISQTA